MSEEKPIIQVSQVSQQTINDLELVKEVLGSPERIKNLLSLARQLEEKERRKLPPGYSLTSNPSYYRPRYAIEVKKILDPLIKEDGSYHIKDLVIEYRKMHSLNKNTLYQRVLMGWKYLIDHLDPQKHYSEIKRQTRCQREHRGIAIRWKSNLVKYLGTESLANATTEIPRGTQSIEWKKELEEFILNAENNQIFKKHNILLTDGQIEIVKGMLKDLPGFIPVEVSRNKVIVMFNDSIEKWEATTNILNK